MHFRGFKNRYIILYVATFLMFALIYYRLFDLQILGAEKLIDLAKRQHILRQNIAPKRGYIVDAKGNNLATSLQVSSIYVVPRKISNKHETAKMLSELLSIDFDSVKRKLLKDKSFVWLKRNVKPEDARAIKALKNPYINIVFENRRFYPHGNLLSHIIGFCNIDNVGLAGIEVTLNKYLKGRAGYNITKRDARGRKIIGVEDEYCPPVHGYNVKLTIDQYVQHILESELDFAYKKWKAKAAVAIVLECKTGKILAVSNRPTYDLNKFYNSDDSSRRNRAITDCYEPGSIFKIVTLAAALQENLISVDDEIFCENGEYNFRRGRVLHDTHAYGTLDFASVIAKSSNIGTVKVAERLGAEKLFHYIKEFGFGELTLVDLPGEIQGIARTPDTWSKISISSIPMGQEIAVTPIQLVTAISAIANGGNLVTPYVVSEIYDTNNVTIKKNHPFVRRNFLSKEVAKSARDVLRKVVEDGTGKNARIDGIPVAGKTGTAQKALKNGRGYSPSDYMSSFMGFVPADDPMLSIIVVLDSPHPSYYGGTVAAPVFKNIAEKTLNYLGYVKKQPQEVLN